MSDADDLQYSLNSKRAELSNVQAERDGYLAYAREIREAYDRLARDKQDMIGKCNAVRSMTHESFATFQGANYRTSYQSSVAGIVSSYEAVIARIDVNMDQLNSLCAQYENKAYQCDGVIGHLRAAINYLVHEIENAFN